jgi:hypothetical protein
MPPIYISKISKYPNKIFLENMAKIRFILIFYELNNLQKLLQITRHFTPIMDESLRHGSLKRWSLDPEDKRD